MRHKLGRKFWLLAAVALVVLTGIAWTQRAPLLTWYYLRKLAKADDESRATWVERVAALDSAAVPALLARLESKDPTVCNNIQHALAALAKRWGAHDARTQALAEEFRANFSGFSSLGQISVLEVMTVMLRPDGATNCPSSLTQIAGEMLHAVRERPELRSAALVLAGALLDRVPAGPWADTCRSLVEHGLSDRIWRARLAAIQLLMRPPLAGDSALLAKVVPLLHAEKALVRRAALVALAPARDVVGEDDLLPLLHDEDVEVRHLCEAALRSRGLTDEHVELARLISDESPAARLKVLDQLARVGDLDPSTWLRRLSQDSASAVRAAAIRAAGQHPRVDITDRLREMAQQDPSETVRQNALFYLRQRK
jgi:HEAT repeat protein